MRITPAPGIAKPERRQHVNRGAFRPAIDDFDADQNVAAIGFRVFDRHVEIAILVEDARIEQFVFEILISPARILGNQVFVREARLGILVKHLHVAVRRRAVEVEIVFLDILAVIALAGWSGRTSALSKSDHAHSTTPARSTDTGSGH